MPVRIAVLSLLPDAGHIISSLRLASSIQKSLGGQLFVIAPDEASGLLTRLPIPIASYLVGSVMPVDYKRQLAQWGLARKPWVRASIGVRMDRTYFTPVSVAGWGKVAHMTEVLRTVAPDIVVGDEHLFAGAYAIAAQHLGIPLVLGSACGSLFPYRMGSSLPDELKPDWLSTVSRNVTLFTSQMLGKVRSTLGHQSELDYRAGISRLRQEWERGSEAMLALGHRLVRVSAGFSGIERLQPDINSLNIDPAVHVLGPLESFVWRDIQCECISWIRSDTRPVVLVSFGTMIEGHVASLEAMVTAARSRGWRCALLSPSNPVLKIEVTTDDFRVFPWADQARVLKEPNVRLFFSHAGSGALQDALWASTPILCSPAGWDQPYNSWLAEKLGLGVWLRNETALTDIDTVFVTLDGLAARAEELRGVAKRLRADQALAELARNALSPNTQTRPPRNT